MIGSTVYDNGSIYIVESIEDCEWHLKSCDKEPDYNNEYYNICYHCPGRIKLNIDSYPSCKCSGYDLEFDEVILPDFISTEEFNI